MTTVAEDSDFGNNALSITHNAARAHRSVVPARVTGAPQDRSTKKKIGLRREARFIKNPDGTPDGGVHALFTIGGRPDQPSGCNLSQEDYSRSSNIITRIPTPTFGLGLIEAIPDSTLVQNLAQSGAAPNDIFSRGGKTDSAVFDDIVKLRKFHAIPGASQPRPHE